MSGTTAPSRAILKMFPSVPGRACQCVSVVICDTPVQGLGDNIERYMNSHVKHVLVRSTRRECAEDLCRNSVQSLSSVLHRHAGGSVLTAFGRSSGLSRADRGHRVPALAVTSGGRGVWFDVACSGDTLWLSFFPSFSAPHLIVYLLLYSGSNGGRRCVLEADCRGIGRTVLCEH